MEFDYAKLKGRVKEVMGTQEKFAKALNLSNVSMTSKLHNQTQFKQQEIFNACNVLQISSDSLFSYFFTIKA